ncbi:MAG: ABC transporter permease subunit [Acidimicrobiia bacterium]|nr:ABC transporter permease subunit [Acidimicrobiia bacterium]
MTPLAQTGFLDDATLDRWTIPFGDWIREITFWVRNHLDWLLNAIEWPFQFLLDTLVDGVILSVSWFWVCLTFVFVGWLSRNPRVGLLSGVAIAVCGLLGDSYWRFTAQTIGMILVAVLLCAAVGIPAGILAGRFDRVWGILRPVLDAMQVVHPFVYILPVIFFWGTGRTPGVMVTMVFAVPPLVRLTNLGIRQVPGDVVEAARAYGAPEWRVLVDVQLPLARAAIMTGLNQTLLLALSMVGIVAIIAGGGLGQEIFAGVGQLNIPQAAASGLALYIVGVVLDRISQPTGAEKGNLLANIRSAWANRRTPEDLLADEDDPTVAAAATAAVEAAAEREAAWTPRPAPTVPRERLGAAVALAGAALVTAGVLLPWSENAGPISGWARLEDNDLAGETFSGLAATGGSWFGILALVCAAFVATSALGPLLGRTGRWPRGLGPDLASGAAIAAVILPAAYLVASPSVLALDYQDGIGPWVAVAGGVVATAGGIITLLAAPYRAYRVVEPRFRWGRLAGTMFAFVVLVGSAFGSWVYDQRVLTVQTPEQLAEIERLRELGTAAAAAQIATLSASAERQELTIHSGVSAEGPELGWIIIAVGALGLLVGALGALVPRISDGRRWLINAVVAGLGVGATLVATAWIISIMRVAPPRITSGAGSFVALLGGLALLGTVLRALTNFRRRVVYDDAAHSAASESSSRSEARSEARSGTGSETTTETAPV